MDPWETKVAFVRNHYEKKGYRVHSGLQFGCELVLYADDPTKVHSDFCIHVVRDGKWFRSDHYIVEWKGLTEIFLDGLLDWREVQTLVRSMPDLHKTLILANVKCDDKGRKTVEELAVATEHAPFRHRPKMMEVGSQKKR